MCRAVVKKQVSYADAYKRSQGEIRKAIPVAKDLGVKIAIENVWNQFLLSPLEAARYVDEFESPSVGWHFDVGNVITYGFPEQWVRILGKRILKLHIKEYSRKIADKQGRNAGFQAAYMTGDNDWPAVMTALDEVGYTGWGIAEQPGGDTLEGLKTLTAGMDQIFARLTADFGHFRGILAALSMYGHNRRIAEILWQPLPTPSMNSSASRRNRTSILGRSRNSGLTHLEGQAWQAAEGPPPHGLHLHRVCRRHL